MPNEKTHFIAGAIVGATVNFAIQSAEMAMDYDRKFDWGEFFLCAGAGAFAGLVYRTASLPLPEGEGRGEGERRIRKSIVHELISASLIAYAISGKHTLKLSRTSRLFLWAFGIGYLSHIALDSTAPKPINLTSRSFSVTYSNL
jgi:hypothetical protein